MELPAMVFQVSIFQCATVNLGRLQYKLYNALINSEITWEHFQISRLQIYHEKLYFSSFIT